MLKREEERLRHVIRSLMNKANAWDAIAEQAGYKSESAKIASERLWGMADGVRYGAKVLESSLKFLNTGPKKK